MTTDSAEGRFRPKVAFNALRKLIDDPEDTPRVFEVIRALAGPSLRRGLRRFSRTEVGRRVLDEEIDLLDTLSDREALRRLPPGSLGRAYYDFIYGESLSAQELVAASANDDVDAYDFQDKNLRRYGERIRDQHDLWHTLTRYGRDPFGEACLLAFTYAQTRNRGVGVITLVGAWKISRAAGSGVLKAMWRAYQAGRHASWLPEQDWEGLLRLPLADVRRQLAIPAPSVYFEVRGIIAAQASEAAA